MSYLNKMLRRVQAMDLTDISRNVMAQSEESYADLQREQFLHGLDSQGNKIGEYKQEAYADLKYDMNKLAGYPFVDLKFTGSFYGKIEANVVGDNVVIESTDSKAEKIEEKYNADGELWGLHGEYKAELKEEIRENLHQAIRKATGLR